MRLFTTAKLSWFAFLGSVSGHYVHEVTVGKEGSFFTPAVIAAQKDDIVSFVFVGDQHGVVQSDPASPCAPKAGGFNSGLAGTKGNNSATPPTWDLWIDDPTTPIWFFCPSSQPSSHCNAGMVGVINVPAIEQYDSFVSSAKQFTQTSLPTPSVILQGAGAHATAAPAVPNPSSSSLVSSTVLSTTSTPSSTASSPSPSADSSTSSSSTNSSKSNAGAIAGGVIGALVGLAAIAALVFFGRKYLQRSKRESKTFFDYQGNSTPMMGPYSDKEATSARRSVEQPSTMSSPSQQSQLRSKNLFSMP